MRDFFDAAVGAHDVARGKPEPDLFLLAAEKLGAEPCESLVFEDAPLGLEAARRAGMRAVAIASTLSADEIRCADHVVACERDFTALDPRSLLSRIAVS
jgi:beta-phosphoglucomutase-like phosphatase (HAD superfamily)